jgi:hypothetical protein
MIDGFINSPAFLIFLCMAEENFREAFSLFPACQKLRPHLYEN